MSRRVLRAGFDPGRYGGMAARMDDGSIELLSFSKFFEDSIHLGAFRLAGAMREIGVCERTEVFFEFIAGYISDARPSPKGMFTFGGMYGAAIGILSAMIPEKNFTALTPHHWQRLVGAPIKDSVKEGRWKKVLQDLARERHPKLPGITQAVCDALLILDAGEEFRK